MLITLTTDFGYQDSFIGVMKGIIAGINQQARVIDISHGIPAHDVMAAALTLQHSVDYFPAGTIHVAVVDPEVGSTRRPLLIECPENFFIGPDNGVLSLAVADRTPTRIVQLANSAYQREPTSRTFHGRDIFAPAAAHLSLGAPPNSFGETLDNFVRLTVPRSVRKERSIEGEIVHIDNFGNLFTNIREHDLTGLPADRVTIVLAAATIRGLAENYASVQETEFVAILNSWGMLEIAAYKDSAQKRTGAKIGDRVEMVWSK
jgi:S-adenosylmethionine hydrolase